MCEAMRDGGTLPKLDFVLGLGDFVNGPSMGELRQEFAIFRQLLGTLPCPFYPVPGNHDISKHEGDPQWEAPYLEAFGLASTNYTFAHGGIRFVMLNNAGTANCTEAVAQSRAAWLQKALAENPDEPKIVCCHMPLIPMREEAVLIESCGFPTWKTQEPECLQLVREYGDSIVAVLSGHLHLTAAEQDAGVWHIDIAGLASYPSDYAIYSVYENRIEVEVRQLPSELLAPGTDLHGQSRHKTDYTDSNHSTHQAYVRGNDCERRFSIELSLE
jgi:3',5'-cyclic AMP phosphodiesterase CpdA